MAGANPNDPAHGLPDAIPSYQGPRPFNVVAAAVLAAAAVEAIDRGWSRTAAWALTGLILLGALLIAARDPARWGALTSTLRRVTGTTQGES